MTILKTLITSITLAMLLFLNFSSTAQTYPSVSSLSNEAFRDSIVKVNSGCFHFWYQDINETKDAIVRLDSVISLVNEYILKKDYKRDSTNFELLITKRDSFEAKSEGIRILNKERRNYHDSSLSIAYKIEEQAYNSKFDLVEALTVMCRLHTTASAKTVLDLISHIQHRETARDLHSSYSHWKNQKLFASTPITPYEIDRNLGNISDRLNTIDNNQLAMYTSYSSAKQKIKSTELYHENDFLTDFTVLGFNQDRELTGGFLLSVNTDYFKARAAQLSWIFNAIKHYKKSDEYKINLMQKPTNDVLSYQTIAFGGVGFTPYIRYQDNFELADTFHNYDRPFGSYVYISRSKNRLWQKGLARHTGEFQIGFIGLESPDAVQAALHKDVVTSSQRVYGWNKQVGSPGRLAFQMNHDFDFLLFSNTNKYKAPINRWLTKKPLDLTSRRYDCIERQRLNLVDQCPKKRKLHRRERAFGVIKNRYAGANVVGELEGKFGGYMTSIGGGLRFSTLDFMHQSGQNVVVTRRKNLYDYGWHFETGIKYRRVIHNTMLEGLGYINSFEKDSFDEDPINFYALQDDQIQRNMFYVDWKIVLQWRKMAFYYQQTFHNVEYNVKPYYVNVGQVLVENPKTLDYYKETTASEYPSIQDRGWYGYGKIGITWLIH